MRPHGAVCAKAASDARPRWIPLQRSSPPRPPQPPWPLRHIPGQIPPCRQAFPTGRRRLTHNLLRHYHSLLFRYYSPGAGSVQKYFRCRAKAPGRPSDCLRSGTFHPSAALRYIPFRRKLLTDALFPAPGHCIPAPPPCCMTPPTSAFWRLC